MNPERIAAWAVGAGIGLITMMLTWLVGDRLAALVWETPTGPTVAFVTAILAGIATGAFTGRRLDRSVRRAEERP
jgi:hypothetical protein